MRRTKSWPRFAVISWISIASVGLVGADLDAQGTSLRFFGSGVAAPTLDRVVIPLDAPALPVDVGATDFTVEVWLKAEPGANTSTADCLGGADDWIYGNIVLDRDVFGDGDLGDWGLSLASGRLIFGVSSSTDGATACGTRDVADGEWHHVALTRIAATGEVRIWVDGALDATAFGGTGDVSYRDGRSTPFTWDPFLVLGAEKHDAGAEFPSFSGWLDDLRLSTVARYAAPFEPPTSPHVADGSTAALYAFDEGAGTLVGDSSMAVGGPSPGERRVDGVSGGPLWSADSPFAALFADGFESGTLDAWAP